MQNLGDIIEQFLRAIRDGIECALRVDKNVLSDALTLLRREPVSFGIECLSHIENPDDREAIKVLIISTSSFAVAGASIGRHIGGAQGAAAGAVTGAVLGFGAGVYVLKLNLRRSPDGGGYIYRSRFETNYLRQLSATKLQVDNSVSLASSKVTEHTVELEPGKLIKFPSGNLHGETLLTGRR